MMQLLDMVERRKASSGKGPGMKRTSGIEGRQGLTARIARHLRVRVE